MKSLNEYMKESLLDDEEELLDKSNLNIFNIISKSESKEEFYKHIKTLCDLCTAVNINDDLSKYKNSFFLTPLVSANNNDCGIKIFKKIKQSLFINYFNGIGVFLTLAKRITFTELKKADRTTSATLKNNIVYIGE